MMKCLTNVMKCTKYKPDVQHVRRDQAASVCKAFWQSALTLSVPDKSGELDFSTFLSVMHAQIRQENPQVEILQAARLMDTEKRGFIVATELRARLTGFGERLVDQEGIVRSGPSFWEVVKSLSWEQDGGVPPQKYSEVFKLYF